MKIQTLSIVAGSEACNARCPFCVSRMTDAHGLGLKEPEVRWGNFRKACRLAERSGVTTAMITGKGEPTLFPDQITGFLSELRPFGFPLIELQSNGILLAEKADRYLPHLRRWHELELSMIAISIVHHEPERNREIYLPRSERYIDLPALIDLLHGLGFSVRLACVMAGGYIDSPEELDRLIGFARDHRVEHLSVRPVARPSRSQDAVAADWTEDHLLRPEQQQAIARHLEERGVELLRLSHGAIVYDVEGQNVCLTDCLTLDASGEDLRQLIFFPDGHLRYDWQYAGAILL